MATMLEHLGRACLDARLASGLRQIDIGTAAGLSHTIVGRFEHGIGIPRDLDRIVLAYASECEVPPSDLWLAAVHAWSEHL